MSDLNPADLRLVSHTTSDGVTTRELVLGDVTAALWEPEDAAPGTPLVLLGHGGGQHRHDRAMSGRARLLTDVGFRAVALDVDGHGPRPRSPRDEEEVALLRAAMKAGEPTGPIAERYNADLARRTVPEWRALLAGLLAVPGIGDAPVGYWGMTLGTAIGVPLVAGEPLVRAAGFGLFWPST
ncbi:alpha/beta hydrolase, partial [Actinosynnema sp. NPDC023658]|uniref:alpha/beta hydrolase n=1 Tax=Actinosynnema sp. NPDC023658 TaxID=3155465 RepID=UPI0033E189A6